MSMCIRELSDVHETGTKSYGCHPKSPSRWPPLLSPLSQRRLLKVILTHDLFYILTPCTSCAYFIRFICKYLIFGGPNVNSIVFLILNSTCALLVYRKATDFCILSLQPATLLYPLTSSRSPWSILYDFLNRQSCHLANKDAFIPSFLIRIYSTSFSCLTALARTSSMMLKRRWEREYPCLVLDLTGKASSFSPLSIMLAISFLQMLLNKLRKFPLFLV